MKHRLNASGAVFFPGQKRLFSGHFSDQNLEKYDQMFGVIKERQKLFCKWIFMTFIKSHRRYLWLDNLMITVFT